MVLLRMVAYRRCQVNRNRWSSHVKKGVTIGLIIVVIGAGGSVAEAEVFHCVFWNVNFWVLDLEVSLGKSLEDMREGEEIWERVRRYGRG